MEKENKTTVFKDTKKDFWLAMVAVASISSICILPPLLLGISQLAKML